jgi:VanZ family protein
MDVTTETRRAGLLAPVFSSSQPRADTTAATGVAKSPLMYNVASMHRVHTSFRILTGCCVVLLALLSLMPAQNMVRTGLPGQLEHFVAYAGSASIAVAGYGRRVAVRIIGLFWVYAAFLEYLQHFSPGRHPSIADFSASALGASFGWLFAALLSRRLWKRAYPDIV